MEREVTTLQEILSVAQQFCDADSITPPKHSFVTPGLRLYAAHHASYSLVNALSWARAVRDRVEHRFRNRAYGLLPSLKDSELKAHIRKDFENLKSQLEKSTFAANYVLHAGALHGPSTPSFQIRPDGRVYFAFPDAIHKPITTWDEHTYDDKLDALVELQKQFDAVAKFIDQMLDAFDTYSR
jgi:hypothetical protein